MNTRANLAYDYDNAVRTAYPSAFPQTSSNVRIKVSNKPERAAVRRNRLAGISKIMLVVAFAFIVLLRGVMLTDKTATIEKKQSELEALIASNEKLQFEIDRSLDLDKVESIARNELRMLPAEKHQTVYINIDQVDYVERTAENGFSFFSQTANFLKGLMAYFD